jgi:predicted RNase H-like nuclease (RuvC/YqgF family)
MNSLLGNGKGHERSRSLESTSTTAPAAKKRKVDIERTPSTDQQELLPIQELEKFCLSADAERSALLKKCLSTQTALAQSAEKEELEKGIIAQLSALAEWRRKYQKLSDTSKEAVKEMNETISNLNKKLDAKSSEVAEWKGKLKKLDAKSLEFAEWKGKFQRGATEVQLIEAKLIVATNNLANATENLAYATEGRARTWRHHGGFFSRTDRDL